MLNASKQESASKHAHLIDANVFCVDLKREFYNLKMNNTCNYTACFILLKHDIMFCDGIPAGIAISAEEPQLWRTGGKAYNLWICELVHSLTEYTDDQILRYQNLHRLRHLFINALNVKVKAIS